MKYWIISPNVTNNKSEEDSWKNAIIKFNVAIIGWGENDDLGRVFIDKVEIGDIILIAQGANWQKKLFLAGHVSTNALNQHLPGTPRAVLFRKLSGVLNADELELLNLNFEGAAYGDARQIPAIYQLKPWQNEFDKSIAYKLMEKINEAKINEEMQNFVDILKYKKQIILQGPPGTGKTKLAKAIAEHLIGGAAAKDKPLEISNENIRNTLKEGDIIPSAAGQTKYKLIKIDDSNKKISLEKVTGRVQTTTFANIKKYFKEKRWEGKKYIGSSDRLPVAVAEFIFHKFEKTSVFNIDQSNQIKIIQFHPSYTYEDFVRGIVSKTNPKGDGIIYEAKNKVFASFADEALKYEERNYVFIIDEINRANLSSVLGELIYALEYRGKAVESMYEVGRSNKLILPPNLYIIGTMNTADRSVGHIDYAIRRRFAFVELLPKILTEGLLTDEFFENELFKRVSALFVDNMETLEPSNLKPSIYLSAEFRPQDVWLGHSYFITKSSIHSKMRLKYEIIPILEEYIKDGVLKESAELKTAIKNLENAIPTNNYAT